ncbi:MAG: DNA (cytosine-5-)-methyltransferase [Ardenticatenaceae bacterium]|nr:DNA (cytosine-5-)-methyltransferase [Ardenticatenaceae bacterium]
MVKEEYTVVSLFSGAGGFDWGFHRAGYKTLLACEILKNPAKTLAKNLGLDMLSVEETELPISPTVNGGGLMVNEDIQNVDFSQLGHQPDIVIGGPPCQDFSMAISKKDEERPGLNGGRGKLYVEFVRALMFLQPKMFVFENVPGLMSANSRTAYDVIKSDLEHLEAKRLESIKEHGTERFPDVEIEGYDLLFSDIVNAPDLGISQTRRRLIIIGLRKDLAQALGQPSLETLSQKFKDTLNGEGSLLRRYPLTVFEIFEGKTLTELEEKYKQVMAAYKDLADSYIDSPPNDAAAVWHREVWSKLTREIKHDYQLVNQIENFSDEEFAKAMEEHAEILKDLEWHQKPVYELKSVDKTNAQPRLSRNVTERMRNIPPGQNYEFADGTDWEVEGKNISFIYRRSDPLKPAWTVMAYGGGGTYGYHYERDRAQLTLRERARIQTFTDDFHFCGPHVRAQIGEAVPPLLGQRIAKLLKPIISKLSKD